MGDEVPFDVTIVHVDGGVELAVSGEIDLCVSDRLWARSTRRSPRTGHWSWTCTG